MKESFSKKHLRLLLIEDSQDDAFLLIRKLKKGGFEPSYELVDTIKTVLQAFKKRDWDIVISDYSMPDFNGITALRLFKETGLDIPFIIVSGTIGEDVAVEAMKEGAHDYLMKDKLERLVPAIERELREAEIRKKRRLAEEEKQKLEEQLRHAQKMEAIGTLAGGIAHDFNNILCGTLGFTEIALKDVEENSRAATCLKQILIAQKRAVDLVKQILAFSRQSEYKPIPILIQPVIQEALKLIRSSFPPSIEIRQDIDQNCGPILGDSTQIIQFVMNLCTNAFHAMDEKEGILTIKLAQLKISANQPVQVGSLTAGDYICFSVSDTGHGIDEETQKRIFEPYFTTKKAGEGTGMGLSIVHGIVQKSGGAIQVESRVGQGSTFHIYLPLLVAEEGETEQEKGECESHDGTERILFVDDEAPITQFAKMGLEDLGYKVVIHTSSVDALEALRAAPSSFDILVADQTMPNMTGLELAAQAHKIRKDLPILLCTGFSEALSKNTVCELGIREVIKKPILIHHLACAIRRVFKEPS